jgi:putative inorganic carbon (HCO3(-)) transporter
MRDVLMVALLFGALPFILRRPLYGYFAWVFVGLTSMHQLAYGFAREFRYGIVIGVATLVSVALSRERLRPSSKLLLWLLIAFALWLTMTTLVAKAPAHAWEAWDRNIKTLTFCIFGILLVRTETDARHLLTLTAVSLGMLGIKGGVFMIVTGGTSHVLGPPASSIGDNNAFAVAMVTTIPLLRYLATSARTRLMGLAIWSATGLTLLAALGTFSRGALVALVVLAIAMIMQARVRVVLLVCCLCVGLLSFQLMPPEWRARMETINDYQSDMSAQGRIMSWRAAIGVANTHFLGGGFDFYRNPEFYYAFVDPEVQAVFPSPKAAHSIYFQVLGEHGYIGLTIFAGIMACGLIAGRRSIGRRSTQPPSQSDAIVASATLGLIAFLAGGAFLNLAYYDLPYVLITIMLGCRYASRQPASSGPDGSVRGSSARVASSAGRLAIGRSLRGDRSLGAR